MRSVRNANYFIEGTREESKNARGAGRVKCLAINSSHGQIIDLSAGGARLLRRSKFKGETNEPFTLNIISGIGNCQIQAHVCWQHRSGLFSWTIGVAFDEVTPEARKVLNDIARAAPLDACTMLHSLNKSA
ncbi:MAG: PilZ domain-containing protein [Phycisphaerales bacterium]